MKEIHIGGQSRPVKYNMNALIEFEELTGMNLLNANEGDMNNLKTMRALAFVGLKYGASPIGAKPDFTLEDVGDWINFGDSSMKNFFTVFKEHNSGGGEEVDGEAKK